MADSNHFYCPCGKDLTYIECCGKLIEQHHFPEFPEQLMRSRYTAFVIGNLDYLAVTMRDPAAKKFDIEETRTWLQLVEWKKLEVLEVRLKSPTLGFVSFKAHYMMNAQPHIIAEKSEFHKIGKQWFYVDGKPIPSQYINKLPTRNALCGCGSNKKYKRCCGK